MFYCFKVLLLRGQELRLSQSDMKKFSQGNSIETTKFRLTEDVVKWRTVPHLPMTETTDFNFTHRHFLATHRVIHTGVLVSMMKIDHLESSVHLLKLHKVSRRKDATNQHASRND